MSEPTITLADILAKPPLATDALRWTSHGPDHRAACPIFMPLARWQSAIADAPVRAWRVSTFGPMNAAARLRDLRDGA
jgi:hypothetical protein